MVLCRTIHVILAKAPRVLRTSGLFREMSQSIEKDLCHFGGILTLYMRNEFSFEA